MKSFNKLVWGVIGAGSVCEVKSVPAMYKAERSEVKIVMRRKLDKAQDFAKRHQVAHATSDAQDIFNDSDINIVYIATPPDTHCEYTLQAAKAGKAVYVEKPMANTAEECQRMIDACREANVPLFVAYYRRKLPAFQRVKEIINSGVLGDIRFVDIHMVRASRPYDTDFENNWRINPEIAVGGYFNDLASHQLDFLDYAFGKIGSIETIALNQAEVYPTVDMVNAIFQFENSKILGRGIWNFNADPSIEKEVITISGSKGHIRFNAFGSPMRIEQTTAAGTEVTEIEMPEHIQQPLVESIVAELCSDGYCPSRGDTAIRTTDVMTKMINNK